MPQRSRRAWCCARGPPSSRRICRLPSGPKHWTITWRIWASAGARAWALPTPRRLSAAFPALGGLGAAAGARRPPPHPQGAARPARAGSRTRARSCCALTTCTGRDPRVGGRAGGARAPARRRRRCCWPWRPARAGLAPSLAAALADALREDARRQARPGAAQRAPRPPSSSATPPRRSIRRPAATRSTSSSSRASRGRARATAAISADDVRPARGRGRAGNRARGAGAGGAAAARRRGRSRRPVRAGPGRGGGRALGARRRCEALDELLACALVRQADAPRRFAFRHPVVRHAVYEATPPGWRLGAHARAAHALERHGAGPVERAHHVEHAARPGDEARHRPAGRRGRRAAIPCAGRRRAVPRRRPAPAARPAGGAGAAQGDAAPARRRPGRLGRPRGRSRDVARGAAYRGRGRAARPDRWSRKRGVVAGPQQRSSAAPPGGARRVAGAAVGRSDPPAPRARP